jgi:hypothetical protein
VQSHTPETALLNGQSPTTDPQKSLNESVMVSLADAKDLSTRWNFTVTPKGKLEVEKNGVAITSTESLAVVKMQNAVGNRNWNVYLRVPRAYFPTSGEAGEYRVNFQRFRPDAEIQKVQSWSPTFGKPGEEQFMGFLTVKEK